MLDRLNPLARKGALLLALLCGAGGLLAPVARAAEALPAVADPVLEARMLRIAAELRCLVCQNQTIADSHADLAVDLRQQVREALQRGESDDQILSFMTARYGDFVLYRPPVKPTTVLLWAGPALLLGGGVLALVMVLRRRSRLPDQAFEADQSDDDEAPSGAEPGARNSPA